MEVRIVLMTILLSGCGSFSDRDLSPRSWDCNAICDGCERCTVNCNMTGQGEDTRIFEIDEPR